MTSCAGMNTRRFFLQSYIGGGSGGASSGGIGTTTCAFVATSFAVGGDSDGSIGATTSGACCAATHAIRDAISMAMIVFLAIRRR